MNSAWYVWSSRGRLVPIPYPVSPWQTLDLESLDTTRRRRFRPSLSLQNKAQQGDHLSIHSILMDAFH